MNRTALDYIRIEKEKRALAFINSIEQEQDKDKKVKLFIDMMTYYDSVNARDFQLFCVDIYHDRIEWSREFKLIQKIKELEEIMEGALSKSGIGHRLKKIEALALEYDPHGLDEI